MSDMLRWLAWFAFLVASGYAVRFVSDFMPVWATGPLVVLALLLGAVAIHQRTTDSPTLNLRSRD